jgi:hypothetical protein
MGLTGRGADVMMMTMMMGRCDIDMTLAMRLQLSLGINMLPSWSLSSLPSQSIKLDTLNHQTQPFWLLYIRYYSLLCLYIGTSFPKIYPSTLCPVMKIQASCCAAV